MKSENLGTVICSECGTRVSIDDAESCYNAELDDVYFVCTKCIEDENRQSPAVSDDCDEAVEHVNAADGFSAWAGDDDQGDGIGFAEVHGW